MIVVGAAMTVRVGMIGEAPRAVKPTRRQDTEVRLQLARLPEIELVEFSVWNR